MTKSIDEVNWNGIYWNDLDWKSDIHLMKNCDECGIDGGDLMMAGHLSFCRYYHKNQESPAGRTWIRQKIEQLWNREQAAKARAEFIEEISQDYYLVD